MKIFFNKPVYNLFFQSHFITKSLNNQYIIQYYFEFFEKRNTFVAA